MSNAGALVAAFFFFFRGEGGETSVQESPSTASNRTKEAISSEKMSTSKQ
jgi:hypothetical protein